MVTNTAWLSKYVLALCDLNPILDVNLHHNTMGKTVSSVYNKFLLKVQYKF